MTDQSRESEFDAVFGGRHPCVNDEGLILQINARRQEAGKRTYLRKSRPLERMAYGNYYLFRLDCEHEEGGEVVKKYLTVDDLERLARKCGLLPRLPVGQLDEVLTVEPIEVCGMGFVLR